MKKRLSEFLGGVSYRLICGSLDALIEDITVDSRSVKQGSMFVCIKGISVDRHDFIGNALLLGATAIIVENDIGVFDGATIIQVEDARMALAKIAANFYDNPSSAMKMVGVTGTKGKTSMTYYLEHVLTEYGKKVGVIGTTGIRADGTVLEIPFATSTTPDTVELQYILHKMCEMGIEYVVMEVSSHALELSKVDDIAFEIGIFTNIAHEHLDFHKTEENYLKAKTKLFNLCKHGVINCDDKAFEYIINNSECGVVTYGIENECDVKAVDIKYGIDGVSFKLFKIDEELFIPIAGRFSLYNALAVIGASLALGVPFETIKRALKTLKGVPGRIEKIESDKPFSVFVDYAHTANSLENIISAVRGFTEGRVIVVFGCGGDRDTAKRPVMGKIAGSMADYCIITSDNPRSEQPESIISQIVAGGIASPYECIADRRKAIYRGIAIAQAGDSVIIAGKGHEDYQELADGVKIHFDDRETVRAALSAEGECQ